MSIHHQMALLDSKAVCTCATKGHEAEQALMSDNLKEEIIVRLQNKTPQVRIV